MKTAVASDDYDIQKWMDDALDQSRGTSLRFGQALFNTAPAHIRESVRSVMELDPFYVDSAERMYIINNFLLFAYLVWEVTDPYEIALAIDLVMNEPNARR